MRITAGVVGAVALIVLAWTGAVGRAQAPASGCVPLETRPPNGASQHPAFAGQTRACGTRSNVAFEVVTLANGLDHPWAVAPLPDGTFLVSERPGRLRSIDATGRVSTPIAGLPAVQAGGQGGLLDLALGPGFASDRTVYWTYLEPREGGSGISVARGVLSADKRRLDQVAVIFRAVPTVSGATNVGSRLAFGPDGMLYVSLGDRFDPRVRTQAQHLDSDVGKIIRLTPRGSAAPDNPFVDRDDARPEIWTLGHRNVQAMAFDSAGRLWAIEHGARGGDELNLIEKGKNYGWPLAAYGVEYSGQPIAGGATIKEGTEQPIYYWDPVIAPSGAQFYTGDAFPAWRGSLFVGALKEHELVRLTLEGNRVTGEEHLLADRGQRIRDVRQGPDGSLLLLTDESPGELWRVSPRR